MNDDITLAHPGAELNFYRRGHLASFPLCLQRQTHCIGVRHPTGQRGNNGALHLGGAIAINQAQQRRGDGAQVLAACTGLIEQLLAGGRT